MAVAKLNEDVRDSAITCHIAPGGTRTLDRRIRNPMLYPPELPALNNLKKDIILRFLPPGQTATYNLDYNSFVARNPHATKVEAILSWM